MSSIDAAVPSVTSGDVPLALDIMREAAAWLNATGKPMWRIEQLTEKNILSSVTPAEVRVGWLGGEAVAAMILQWSDPVIWPGVADDAGYIHKLAVRRVFAGTGCARGMVEWAIDEARRNGKAYLRLDCMATRPKLREFYERLGFRLVEIRNVRAFYVEKNLDLAFYELRIG